MKLIYFAYGNVSVFDSQVVALLDDYLEKKMIEEIHLVIGIRKKYEKEKYKDELTARYKLHFYKHYPQYPIIGRLTEISLSNITKIISKNDDYVFHVRNEVLGHHVYNAMLKSNINTSKLLIDIRGAGLEQLEEFGNLKILTHSLKRKYREDVYRTISKINTITVVSDTLKNYVLSKIKVPETNVSVIHSLTSNNFKLDFKDRQKVRQSLGLKSGDILFLFSTGGQQPWQNTEKIITELSNRKFKVLNLSKKNIENPNVINRFVSYTEVPKYLNASDIAVIWREKTVTNKVAAPVKFGEYLCCGLPVISNDSVDLVSDVIMKHKCGKIIDDIKDVDNDLIKTLLEKDRSKIAKIGKTIFGIEKIAEQYSGIYNKILRS